VAPLGNDQTQKEPSTLAVWKDAAFLHYRAANILLQIAVGLFRFGLLPRSALSVALRLSSRLQDRGAYFHAQERWRRLRARLGGGGSGSRMS